MALQTDLRNYETSWELWQLEYYGNVLKPSNSFGQGVEAAEDRRHETLVEIENLNLDEHV